MHVKGSDILELLWRSMETNILATLQLLILVYSFDTKLSFRHPKLAQRSKKLGGNILEN